MTLAVTCFGYSEYVCDTLTHDAIICGCVWFEHQVLCREADHVANRANGRGQGHDEEEGSGKPCQGGGRMQRMWNRFGFSPAGGLDRTPVKRRNRIPSVSELSVWFVDTWTGFVRIRRWCALRVARPLEEVPVVQHGVSGRIFVGR